MQIKHVDKRLKERERYVRTIKTRTLAVMITSIVICALYLLSYFCALGSYVHIANNVASPQLIFTIENDPVAIGWLSAWTVTWFIFIIVGFFGLAFMIFNCVVLFKAATKMARRYTTVRIRGWFIMILVFAIVMVVMLIIDLGFSAQSYAVGTETLGFQNLGWMVAGPAKTIQAWMNEPSSAAMSGVVLIPIATMVLSIIQRTVGKRYIAKLYAEDR